jgi:purine catabolism regulator
VLTVRSLVSELGLELLSGADAADTAVRWVHSTELRDPTPWLSGGELVLTTGLQLQDVRDQKAFVTLVTKRGLAGVGFGTGFGHDEVPAELVKAATAAGLAVFEVPYDLPFIAITEKAFTQLVNEQYDALQRGTAVHRRLERLVLAERGLGELLTALADAIGASVVVLDGRGETLAGEPGGALAPETLERLRDEVHERTLALGRSGETSDGIEIASEQPAGDVLVLPVATHGRGAPQAWLVAARHDGIGDYERLILQHGATVVALELMRQRAMRETERRLAGDVLAEAVGGSLGERETGVRLAPFGVGERSALMVFQCDDFNGAERDLEALLVEAGVAALVAVRGELVCAVVDVSDNGDQDPIALAARLRDGLQRTHGAVRAATSRVGPSGRVRHAFHEARCALEATALANGSAPDVASYRDLGAFQLLLALQDDEALRLYCDSVLAPLLAGGEEYGDELTRSVEVFIECGGQWERAARELYCHRHTLRYRIRRVEELTGRDLSSARDRTEFWLALRARELVA